MNTLPESEGLVTGGVDTHRDLHVAAVIDAVGRVLGTEAFAVDADGYEALLTWMRSFGTISSVGMEGTGSYGAGLFRHLTSHGVAVLEVIRPNRQARRRRGKSDPADAEAAARAALCGEASGTKARNGAVEAIRALRVVRCGAVKASTQASNQLKDLIVSAPEALRARLMGLSTPKRVELAIRFRPGTIEDPTEATKAALRSVARRWVALQCEITEIDRQLAVVVTTAAPEGLLAKQGVGFDVAGALLVAAGDNAERLGSEAGFAALCGASPIDASSGKQVRHRLNRGGDRQANVALWRIVMTRMACDPRTAAYVARRTAQGMTKKEIIRCLKRYVAREIYRELVIEAPHVVTGFSPPLAA
ncbi:MAG: IS110 family transposase [Acidimicrobiales bacterium]|nr:IS110 family transposase [Acidimicrobiales bacterium]